MPVCVVRVVDDRVGRDFAQAELYSWGSRPRTSDQSPPSRDSTAPHGTYPHSRRRRRRVSAESPGAEIPGRVDGWHGWTDRWCFRGIPPSTATAGTWGAHGSRPPRTRGGPPSANFRSLDSGRPSLAPRRRPSCKHAVRDRSLRFRRAEGCGDTRARREDFPYPRRISVSPRARFSRDNTSRRKSLARRRIPRRRSRRTSGRFRDDVHAGLPRGSSTFDSRGLTLGSRRSTPSPPPSFFF